VVQLLIAVLLGLIVLSAGVRIESDTIAPIPFDGRL
jgi:hypothetical protein